MLETVAFFFFLVALGVEEVVHGHYRNVVFLIVLRGKKKNNLMYDEGLLGLIYFLL